MRQEPAIRAGAVAGRAMDRPALLRRVVTILWGVPLVAGCVWIGGWFLAAAAAVLTAAALLEFWMLGRSLGVSGSLRWEVCAGSALLLAGASVGVPVFSGALAGAVLLVLIAGVVRAVATPGGAVLRTELWTTVWSILALLYIPWLLGHLLLLRGADARPVGLHLTLLAVGLVWVGDGAAYLVGGVAGRHRLAASVSPGKSVEGAVVAMAAAAAVGAAAAGWALLPPVAAAVVGAALAAAGMAGDLWESVLKRAADVKDSGGGVPGHGGVLDRFDSLLLAAPVAYWLLDRVPWAQLLHTLW